MKIETKYDIKDKVEITELGAAGRVVSIWITPTGIQIEVKYFMDGKLNKEYFYEDELDATRK
jgi:hypothetical protein